MPWPGAEVLKQTSLETAELMTVIERKQEEASAKQASVAKEEEAATEQARRTAAERWRCDEMMIYTVYICISMVMIYI